MGSFLLLRWSAEPAHHPQTTRVLCRFDLADESPDLSAENDAGPF